MEVSRRTLLVGVGAATLAPSMPAVAGAPLPTLPCFAVGTPGDHNWRVFFAATAERAKELWYADYGEVTLQPGEKDIYGLEVRDVSYLDAQSPVESIHSPTTADCIAMEWDNNCTRCYNDVSLNCEGYHDIGGDCVCTECLTAQEQDALDHDDFLNDFINERHNAADPVIFALLRPEDFLDDTIRDVLADEAGLHPECLHLAPFARPNVSASVPSAEVSSDD